jgi:vesicle coat complex subunit
VTLLSSEPEIQYVALRNINLIVQKRAKILEHEIKVFFCKYNDPIYVKMEKLEIMIKLTQERNIDQVRGGLPLSASDVWFLVVAPALVEMLIKLTQERNIDQVWSKTGHPSLPKEGRHSLCTATSTLASNPAALLSAAQIDAAAPPPPQVLMELKEYATEVDVDFVRRSVRAIGRCAIKLEKAAERCINVLLELIQTKVNYVVQEAVIVIKDIFRKFPNRYGHRFSPLTPLLNPAPRHLSHPSPAHHLPSQRSTPPPSHVAHNSLPTSLLHPPNLHTLSVSPSFTRRSSALCTRTGAVNFTPPPHPRHPSSPPIRYESIIGTLCENLDTLDEPEAKGSMIWIIGEYAERIDNADELLESFLETFDDETPAVQLQVTD